MSIHGKYIRYAFVWLLLTGVAASSRAQAPDNTANNKEHNVTADQQSNSASDRATAQKIRKSIVADKALSVNAHNIKIICSDGMVTLKGPVDSENEKQEVFSKAAAVVDQTKIDNQMTVKNP
jgi:hyperosmotically inducible periplasmic protein